MDLLELKPENYLNISVSEMDGYHAELVAYREYYEKEKENLSRIFEALEKRKNIFGSILEATGRTSYKSESGNFTMYYRDSYRMENKDVFYSWFRDKFGAESLDALTSVNYNSLNSFIKGMITEQNEEINNIPGITQTVDGPIYNMRSI